MYCIGRELSAESIEAGSQITTVLSGSRTIRRRLRRTLTPVSGLVQVEEEFGLPTRHCDIAIIGAGTAGLHAYKSASKSGGDVLVIERGPGGSTCTATGCIPSKLLIAAGRSADHARKAALFGIAVDGVAVDGDAVLRRMRAERDKADGKIRDQYLAIPEARRLHGEARFTGPTTLLVDGTTVEARAVIVAVGAHPEIPAPLEPVRAVVHTHETIFAIERLPASLAVIGAGPLGLELAQAFARLGVIVTVLGKSDKLGALKDPEAESAAREALEKDFAIHLGVELTAAMAGDQARLSWTGASEGDVTVDLILAATGRTPNLDALDLAASGVVLDDKGVPEFDPATRRCGDTQVYVAGDVDAWRPVLHEASRGGTIAGCVAAGGAAFHPIPSLAIAFTEPNLVEVGAAFGALPDGAIVGTVMAKDNARSGIDGEDEGLVRLYADKEGKLLGGSIVLTGGEHLGQSLALAIDRGLDAAALADQAWYHPVLEEMLQEAARDVIRQL